MTADQFKNPVQVYKRYKLYEIWSEGYRITGEAGKARRWGCAFASIFRNACNQLARGNSDFRQDYNPAQIKALTLEQRQKLVQKASEALGEGKTRLTFDPNMVD